MCVIRGGRTGSGFLLETHAKREQQASRLLISFKGPLAGSKAPVLRVVHIYPIWAATGCGQPFCVSAGVLSFPFPISPFMPFNDCVTRSVRGCGKVPFIRNSELIK